MMTESKRIRWVGHVAHKGEWKETVLTVNFMRSHMADQGIVDRIILKRVLRKYIMEMQSKVNYWEQVSVVAFCNDCDKECLCS
jgi:hypothetical protein